MSDGQYQERHYDELGEHCGKMITKVRAPDLSILDCIWVSPGKPGITGALSGYPVENTIRLDQLLASTDPVALDYWASKYILYPIDNNKEHHPDLFDPLHKDITQARDVINSNNGINGHRVTFNESTIKIRTQSFP